MFGFFKKKKAPEQVSEVPYILAIADCISHNNSTVHDSLERCRNDRAAYAAQFAERFAERGIDAASCDMDTLCWIAMADELEAVHDLIGVDSSSELEDFLWAVSQLNGGETLDFPDWTCRRMRTCSSGAPPATNCSGSRECCSAVWTLTAMICS